MNNLRKAEFIILKNNKFFIWITLAFVLLIGYNIFSIATELEFNLEGGYYTYSIMALAFLLGIIFPMMLGAFFGGYDENVKMMEFKLTNQSVKQWLICRTILMFFIEICCLGIVNLIGIILDIYRDTFEGGLFENVKLITERFFAVLLVWFLWSVICFAISQISKSPGTSLMISLFIYFGEQYIEQYTSFTYGILWNQKSFEHYFFHINNAPFGVVQPYFNSMEKSISFIFAIIILFSAISYLCLKKKISQKITEVDSKQAVFEKAACLFTRTDFSNAFPHCNRSSDA